MTRTHTAGALIVISALLHGSCCDCDKGVSPTVVATPTPTPAPTPTPVQCTRGGVPASFRCAAEPPPRFQAILIAAQDQVRREFPGLFDSAGRVFSQEQYTGQLGVTLRAQGHCADGGTDDEISLKPIGSNEFSELYDVVTSNRDVWNNYVFTCRPSLF